MIHQDSRPRFLNLFRIRLPITGVVSIAHRIAGVLLVLAIPFGFYLLDLSLQGPEGFHRAGVIVAHPLARLAMILLGWALAHHLLAGIRALFIDVDLGVTRAAARRSAGLAIAGGVIALLVTAGWLL